jgi:ketosteroid isomerase-like protein
MAEVNLEFVRRWWGGFNEDGMPSLELCDEQIEINNPSDFPVRGPYHGHEGVRQWQGDVFEDIEDAEVVVEKLIDVGDGETVVMFLRLRGVAGHTRIPVDASWAAVWKIRNGRLLHAQGFLTQSEALDAVGLSE